MNNRIMILSEKEDACTEMAMYFRESRYSVIWCTDYLEAISLLSNQKYHPEVFLFDMGIPGREEYDVIRKVTEHSDIRMVILSEDSRLDSQLYAYSMKIDDYIVKPSPMPLVEAHIEAILRRNESSGHIRNIGAISIDYEGRRVYLDGKGLEVTAKEFDLLDFFVNHRGMVLSRDKILDSVWGYDYIGGYRSVDTLVKKLRAKLTKEYPYIRTIYGVGYCFDI